MGGDPYGYEPELYFYQGDHLSSTQVVTDINGMVKQGVLYAPFGEVITEYNAYWHQGKIPDYMFNAKELDEENGMYYYEARYYNPPMFISRDPLFEKKPWLNPYIYCSNNPINRIDPDGRDDYGLDVNTGRLSLIKKTRDKIDNIYTGTFGIGRAGFKKDKNGQPHAVSKGILNATNKVQDISKTGFVAGGGKQKEGIDLVKYISFSTGKELSGFGYTDNNSKDGAVISRWDKNTSNESKTHIPMNGYKILDFHFHTHPNGKDGRLGYGKPSITDLEAANKFYNEFGITNFYIISQKEGVSRYNQFGTIPASIGSPLPQSLFPKK
jgi:RHS repeat-associated protein